MKLYTVERVRRYGFGRAWGAGFQVYVAFSFRFHIDGWRSRWSSVASTGLGAGSTWRVGSTVRAGAGC